LRLQSGIRNLFISFGPSIRDEWQKLLDVAFTNDSRISLPAQAAVAETKESLSSGSAGSDAMRAFFGQKVMKALADAVSGESYRVKLEMPHMTTQTTKTQPSAADGINPPAPKTVTHRTRITDKYSVIKVGKELDKQAVAHWIAALSDESSYNLEKEAPDFGPEVAFKLLNGEEMVCVEISFLSNRVRLGQKFSSGKAARMKPELRAKLFKLVKEAFPDEKDIQRLPATWAWGIQVLEPDENDADTPDHSDM
jgi:hypothetical protein